MSSTSFKIYHRVNELPKEWDTLLTDDVFLKTSFLNALERACPKNITPYYVGVFNSQTLAGLVIIQRVEMYLNDAFRKTSDNYLKQFAKALISKIVRGNGMVVGSLMHTGQHGLYYNKEVISESIYLTEVFNAVTAISKEIKEQHNKKIRIIGFKDYFEKDSIHDYFELFEKRKMYRVQVQPNMILEIKSTWETIDDYIFDLKKKYKRRYKTARKKQGNIICKELTAKDIETASEAMYALYKNVSDNARVNSFVLPKDHFYSLKQSIRHNFRVFGYYLEEELVGFYSLILNNKTLETYFLGYNKALQSQHQMYLNMLFDMLTFAITNKFNSVVYARTAMEIKSSIGAKPNAMHIYMKHTNNFIANAILKFVVNTLNPNKKWEERHPFK